MAYGDQRSLTKLQQEAERSRAELADTVNQLRMRVSDTVTDLRERASPDALKAEASKYVQEKADAWVQRARDNPLQAAAIGLGAAYPLFRIVRTIPTPIIMVAAGLYLMGTKSGQTVASQAGQRLGEAGSTVSDQLGGSIETLNRKAEDMRAVASTAGAGVAEIKRKGVGLVGSASDGLAALKDRAVTAAIAGSDSLQDLASRASVAARDGVSAATERGIAATANVGGQAREMSRKATAATADFAQQNPLLVGGLGLALGMLIASALPKSEVEKNALGEASAEVRKRANALAAQGFETAKNVTTAALADFAGRAGQEELTPDNVHAATEDIGRRVRAVAERAADAAFGGAAKTVGDGSTASGEGA